MQRLSEKHDFVQVDKALRFLAIRLMSRPETITMVADINAIRGDLCHKNEEWQQITAERIAATQETCYLENNLVKCVSNLIRDALQLVENNRADPRFQTLFTKSPGTSMRPTANDEQEIYTREIIRKLIEEPSLDPLRAHAETMKTHLDALNDALERRDELYLPESKAYLDKRITLDRARRIYNTTYPRLRLVYPDNEELIETFFMTF